MPSAGEKGPKALLRLLSFLNPSEAEGFIGDVEEEYHHRIGHSGRWKTHLWLLGHTLKAIPHAIGIQFLNGCIMIQNHVKLTLRHLTRDKVYAGIHVFGLALGIACFLLMLIYVQNELSYDTFHTHARRTYRIVSEDRTRVYMNSYQWAQTHRGLMALARQEIPEIESSVMFLSQDDILISAAGENHRVDDFVFCEPSMLDVFTLPLIQGDIETVLRDPHSILLSRTMAQTLFGANDPLQQTITFEGETDLKVTGVFEDIPDNSHFNIQLMVPWALRRIVWESDLTSWTGMTYGYIRLRPGADAGAVEAQLNRLPERYFYTSDAHRERCQYRYRLQPLTSIHLGSHLNFELKPNISVSTLYVASLIGSLILLIACINYMNLSTARAVKRSREVGIRKVSGAHRGQIMVQFFSESLVYCLASGALALILVHMATPTLSRLLQRDLHIAVLLHWKNLALMASLLAGVTLLSGLYPALLLSSYTPASVLGGRTSAGPAKSRLRDGLVIVQFAVTTILIICMIGVKNQIHYIQHRDVGYDRNQIVAVPLRNIHDFSRIQTMKRELRRHPGILGTSLSSNLPHEMDYSMRASWPGMPEDRHQMFNFAFVDYDFLDLFGLEILAGRNFSPDHPADLDGAFILNETAVHTLGWDDPVGREFNHWDFQETRGIKTGTVIGVVRDFNFLSFHHAIEPLYIMLNMKPGLALNGRCYLTVKIDGQNFSDALTFIQDQVTSVIPDQPFQFRLMDDIYQDAYRNEVRTGEVLSIFSLIAIFIACMGLFGLASYNTARRTREFGIRKVLGASTFRIVVMLSVTFLRRVALALVVAFPVAFWLMREWLSQFAFQARMTAWVFIMAAGLTLAVALISTLSQAVRAAIADPVRTLKYE